MEAAKAFIHNHNRIKTRAHGEIPLEVMHDNEADWRAFQKLYGTHVKRPSQKRATDNPKLHSTVRLSRLKWPHEKESSHKGSWTKEIFKIAKIDTTQTKPMFQLTDINDQTVRGQAYK